MKQNKKFVRIVPLLIVLAAVLIAITSFLFAAYMKRTANVKNTFIPAKSITPEVKEHFDGKEKTDVRFYVGNTGYPVYVRASIVVTWKRDDSDASVGDQDDVYYLKPVEGWLDEGDPDTEDDDVYYGDYLMDLNLSADGWVKEKSEVDGLYYYYYVLPVESGGETGILINKCVQINPENAPLGYILSVDIIVQTVQAIGTTDEDNTNVGGNAPAYKDAWNNKETFVEPGASGTTDDSSDDSSGDPTDDSTDTTAGTTEDTSD